MQIDSLPVWIFSRIESPSILVELVTKDEQHLVAALIGRPGISFCWSVLIYQTPVAHAGNLENDNILLDR